MGNEIHFATIASVVGLLERKELSPVELVRAHLDRASAIAHLNAFITVLRDDALAEARESEGRRRRGESKGPLDGIPVTAKDIVWSKGRRTTSGSRIDADFVPDRDAPSLASLRAAGAVLIGKTNLHEFAYGVSNVNPHYGAARNPWDRSRISGGSSGGSAVALAAGAGFGSIGTDTGGSIRIPSALCCTVGLKPTYDAISREGVTPLSWSFDHVGPMARTVEDVALLYAVLTGGKIGARLDSLRGVKLGLHQRYFFEAIAPEVEASVRTAIAGMVGLGAEIVEVDVPEIEKQAQCRNTIAFAEAASYHEENIKTRPEEYGELTRELLRRGLLISATEYLAAMRSREPIVEAFRRAFEGFDVLVTPATPAPAPDIQAKSLETGEELRSGLLRLASPFNTVGFPAISVPCGFTPDGRPIGLQLAAAPGNEARLLGVARAFEESRPMAERWPQRVPDWSKPAPAV
jgi:aspartyl-tRNA(Asn)/glutamyl-tRNA(Gln) amidotransferase subunit A